MQIIIFIKFFFKKKEKINFGVEKLFFGIDLLICRLIYPLKSNLKYQFYFTLNCYLVYYFLFILILKILIILLN